MSAPYDAILIVAFGGPEKREDVLPFLENVLRGRNVPRERMLEVAEHYEHFDGRSPLNDQVRELIAALRRDLDVHGIDLPIYWGNRNWHPLLQDAVREMTAAGVRRALAVVLAAYSSYSSCRQYLENIDEARAAVGPGATRVEKVRAFFNHPGFVEANADRLREALSEVPPKLRATTHVAFTAHSIPASMAAECAYEAQLHETGRLVAEATGMGEERWRLVYQSRSGRPQNPWLEPDVCDHLGALVAGGVESVVLMPIGFLSDHLEVLYDLDVEARATADELGLTMVRAATVGTHPRFVSMLRELIEERLSPTTSRPTVGSMPALADVCPPGCCPVRSVNR
ncbi:MAG: ferrochelatase [Planctomycetes bacterium]|nr:ferrochelatase [Planctomycetota bacterium]